MKACRYCKFHEGDGFPYGDVKCVVDGNYHYDAHCCEKFQRLTKTNKNDKLISQAKCATVDACMNCSYAQNEECLYAKCHVWNLIKMLQKMQEEDKHE